MHFEGSLLSEVNLSVVFHSEMELKIGVHLDLLSQAPSNMKSVLQAGWLLTVAVGNIIVLIVAGVGHFNEQVRETGAPLH